MIAVLYARYVQPTDSAPLAICLAGARIGTEWSPSEARTESLFAISWLKTGRAR